MFLSAHKEEIDTEILESDLKRLGLRRMYLAFANFCVELLGCPPEDIPLYERRYVRKAPRILSYILRSGNFGHKEERPEKAAGPYLVRKWHSFIQLVVKDRLRHFFTFPADSLKIFAGAFRYGLIRLSKGV